LSQNQDKRLIRCRCLLPTPYSPYIIASQSLWQCVPWRWAVMFWVMMLGCCFIATLRPLRILERKSFFSIHIITCPRHMCIKIILHITFSYLIFQNLCGIKSTTSWYRYLSICSRSCNTSNLYLFMDRSYEILFKRENCYWSECAK